MDQIFIPNNVPSSKNSRVWTGKFSVSSALVTRWKKDTQTHWDFNKNRFLKLLEGKDKPYKIGLHFVRTDKRRYDWVNPVQTIQDAMVKIGWLKDDNISEMVPFPTEINGTYHSIDKTNPGVFISVL